MSDHVAMCPGCDEPLVATFAFSGKEFICLSCGRLYAWLEPASAEATPELLARCEQMNEEWQPIGSALLSGGKMLKDCPTCASGGAAHIRHATSEEIAAHEAAVAQLKALKDQVRA